MSPSTEWKEVVTPGEAERFARYAELLHALQQRQAAGARAGRAVHNKGHVGALAELEVLPDLPEPARVALFAHTGKYRAWVRFSNGSPGRHPDRKPDVRGVAIKVVGVAGQKLIPGMENEVTQDFLMIRSPSTGFRSADEFVSVLTGVGRPPFGVLRAGREVGFGRLVKILKATLPSLKDLPASLATTRFYSAAPIKFGPYAAQYGLSPHAKDAEGAKPGQSPAYLADELGARLKEGPVVYDLQVQFFVDEARTPIEDGSVVWKESDAPWVTVARLTLLKQDVTSERGKKVGEQVDGFAFDPWHAVEDFRPLGNMMRARNVAYRVSTEGRKAAEEPDGTEWLGPPGS